MFKIGDKIVYPVHGAGEIKDIEEKEILGQKRKYYIMKMPIDDMKVMIPMDSIDEVGIRPVISREQVNEVLDILASEVTGMHQNWNKRYRANMDRIKSGDIYEVAEVVKNLTLRDREKTLSTGERKILNNAKQILISEIILASDLKEPEIIDLIEKNIKSTANYPKG